MIRSCSSCGIQVAYDARFCSECGQRLPVESANTFSTAGSSRHTFGDEQQDWINFLGPSSEYYLQQFKKFHRDGNERFALTWNWYPFLFGWLWFLYRKMYLYAAAFAIGPFLTLALFHGGVESLFMWGLAAGGLANYLYYSHVKRILTTLHRRHSSHQQQALGDTWNQTLSDVGGVQPYVWWLGAGIVIMAIMLGFTNPQPENPPPNQPAPLEGNI